MFGSCETVDCGYGISNSPSTRLYHGSLTGRPNLDHGNVSVVSAHPNTSYDDETVSQYNLRVGVHQVEKKQAHSRIANDFEVHVFADVDDEMASEEKRLESFKQWPDFVPVKPQKLASAGFYYTGTGDQVRCFSCDLQLRKWVSGDDPLQEHRSHRPNCRFLVETERESLNRVTCEPMEATSAEGLHSTQQAFSLSSFENRYKDCLPKKNISFPALPIGAVPEVSRHLESISQNTPVYIHREGCLSLNPQQSMNITSGDKALPHIFVRTQELRPGFPQEESVYHPTEQGNLSVSETHPEPLSSCRPMVDPQQQTSMYSSQGVRNIGHSHMQMPYTGFPGNAQYFREMNTKAPLSVSVIRPQLTSEMYGNEPTRAPERSAYEQHPIIPKPYASRPAEMKHKEAQASTIITQEEPRRRPPVKKLSIPVQGPMSRQHEGPLVRSEDIHHITSPTDLHSEHHRLTTFVDWPEDSPVRPWELSSAGFYYLGNGDSVKCFKCGVALRNWEPQDTPWEEHEKWSQECPLVIEHFQSRLHVRPVESQEPVQQGEPQKVNPYRYSEYHQIPGHSNAGRQSSPTERGSEIPVQQQQRPPMFLNTGTRQMLPTDRPEINFGLSQESQQSGDLQRSFENHLIQTPSNTQLEEQPPISSPLERVTNHSISAADVNRAFEMGFTRQDIDNAFIRKMEISGSSFTSLDELMQALLESNENQQCGRENPQSQGLGYSRSYTASQLQLIHHRQTALPGNEERGPCLSAGIPLSLPKTTQKQILRRTHSAPSASTESQDESLQQKLERMQEERMCKICMDAEVGIVFLPCGHLSCCSNCALGMEMCPMCRAPIQETIRTFLS